MWDVKRLGMKIKNEKKKKKVNHHQIGGNLGIYAAHKSVTLRDESENIKKAFFFLPSWAVACTVRWRRGGLLDGLFVERANNFFKKNIFIKLPKHP